MEHWIFNHLYLIPILPLLGAIVNGCCGYFIQRRWGRLPIAVIACTTSGLAFLLSLIVWFYATGWDAQNAQRAFEWYTWLQVGELKADIAFLIDPLSSVMMLVVTGVGFLIHVYSKGYMDHDKSTWRFFCYLNLFLFAMLVLVMGENLFMMFIGWEGVGLCSYLLIGFWYQHHSNSTAGNKAFIVNRIGDFGFVLGLALLFWTLCGSPLMHQGDIDTSLPEKLRVPQDPVAEYVYSKLAASTQQMLQKHQGALSLTMKSALTRDLNKLIQGDNLYQVAAWQKIELPTEVRKLASQDLQGTQLVKLNRQLLSAAFPGQIQAEGSATVRFYEINDKANSEVGWGGAIATLIGLLLFVGATGKSAQIPLYVWLPDAMAGPTPVSALIHAATMVTSGVYMIGRLNPIFTAHALTVVAIVGAVTALFAATIALTQNDIKKVLAYSTVSQLGYMFLGMGVGAFAAGIFHLVTHAFFKGLLFLGSGSVIHAMSDEQDMRHMGGLKNYIPLTYKTFLAGTLAISGFPLLSGFFSKDEILWQTFNAHNLTISWLPHALWAIAWITAGLTSFYMFRLLFMTFFGECRADRETKQHIHESPHSMTVPLIVLAIFAVFAGFLGVPDAIGAKLGWDHSNSFHHFVAPVLAQGNQGEHHGSIAMELLFMALSVGIFIVGYAIARIFYVTNPHLPGQIKDKFTAVYALSFRKYFVDEIYDRVFVKGVMRLMHILAWFDNKVIDRTVNETAHAVRLTSQGSRISDERVVDYAVNFVANTTHACGRTLRKIQTGTIQTYFYSISGGVAVIVVILYFIKEVG